MEVMPVDEFFDRLSYLLTQEDPASEDPEEFDESPSNESKETAESVEAVTDLPAVDSDPIIGIVDYLIDMISDLDKIEKQISTIQGDVEMVAQTVDHLALTTSFADYTMTEVLLLFLLLAMFVSACARMLRGG